MLTALNVSLVLRLVMSFVLCVFSGGRSVSGGADARDKEHSRLVVSSGKVWQSARQVSEKRRFRLADHCLLNGRSLRPTMLRRIVSKTQVGWRAPQRTASNVSICAEVVNFAFFFSRSAPRKRRVSSVASNNDSFLRTPCRCAVRRQRRRVVSHLYSVSR